VLAPPFYWMDCMTIAELHGKLAEGRTTGYEYMEDLLTSCVFGTMRYAGWECGFLDWLLGAEPAPVEPHPPPIASVLRGSSLVDIQYRFWPRLTNGREPDLALLVLYEDGPGLLVVIETKYLSGMSDYESDAPEGEDALTGNQILDQVRGMEKMAPTELLAWFEEDGLSPSEPTGLRKVHILVTAHTALPKGVYQCSMAKRQHGWVPCYWLSWVNLADCLEPYRAEATGGQRALLNDLYRLLYRKKLVRFRNGFRLAPWLRLGSETSFWQEHWWSETPWQPFDALPRFWQQPWWFRNPWSANGTEPSFWRE
jgi:hypothetical protein